MSASGGSHSCSGSISSCSIALIEPQHLPRTFAERTTFFNHRASVCHARSTHRPAHGFPPHARNEGISQVALQTDHAHRRRARLGRSVAELAPEVRAPTPHFAVRAHGARVRLSGGDVDHVVETDDTRG